MQCFVTARKRRYIKYLLEWIGLDGSVKVFSLYKKKKLTKVNSANCFVFCDLGRGKEENLYDLSKIFTLVLTLKINSSTGKKKKIILTESNETYTECSRLQINDMCQTILEENVYWLSNEHRKTRKSR